MKKHTLPLILLTVLAAPAWLYAGGLPVYDAVADAKRTIATAERYLKEARDWAQTIKGYENDIRGVYNTGEIVYQGGKQLASMPQNLSVLGMVAHYDNALARLSGMVDTSTRSMGNIYEQVGTVATAEGRQKLLVDMRAERIRLMQVLVAAKADQQWVTEAQKRLREIAQAANNAEGQKAVAQAVANAAAMQAAHDKQVQAWQEAMGKVALLEKLEQEAIRQAAAMAQDEYWRVKGPSVMPGWNGMMINKQGGR